MEKKESCYICGKITGLEKAEYLKNFAQADQQVTEMGFIPVNPVDFKLPKGKTDNWNNWMDVCIPKLTKCKNIFIMKNFIFSKGARLEERIACDYSINRIYESEL